MQVDGLRDSAQTSRSDLFNLDSVEVIKGPNSVFGGSGTTGGSINMISKAQVHGFHRDRRAPGHRPLQAAHG